MNSLTLNEIAYNLSSALDGGRSSNNERLSIEQIKFNIKVYRATFLRRNLRRNSRRARMFEEDLGHVSVSMVDTAEDSSITSGNRVLRTDDELPTPVRLKNSQGFTHISGADKAGEPIPLLESVRTNWIKYSKYTSNKTFCTYRNGYIYIFNSISLQTINIRGVFEDPEEVFNFTKTTETDLYTGDEPFPMSMDMVQRITQGLVNGELKVLKETEDPEDQLDEVQNG